MHLQDEMIYLLFLEKEKLRSESVNCLFTKFHCTRKIYQGCLFFFKMFNFSFKMVKQTKIKIVLFHFKAPALYREYKQCLIVINDFDAG